MKELDEVGNLVHCTKINCEVILNKNIATILNKSQSLRTKMNFSTMSIMY